MARLDDVKVLLDITDSSQNAKLTLIIAGVEKMVEEMTGIKITQGSVTELFNGKTEKILLLKFMPVNSLTTVKYWDGSAFVAFDTDHYKLDKVLGEVIFPYGTPRGVQNIEIVYSAGDATLRADLNDAINDIVMAKYSARPGVKSESVDGASVTYADPESIKNHPVLSQFIRV